MDKVQAEVQMKEAQSKAQAYQALVKSEGWVLLLEEIEEQLEIRKGDVFMPLKELIDVATKEYQKGEVQGMYNVILLPGQQVEENEAITEELQRLLGDENEDET